MSKTIYRLLVVVCMLSIMLSGSLAPATAATWQSKVDAWVLDTAAEGETEFLVFLTTQADLGGADELLTKQEKGRYVYAELTSTAERTQGALLSELARLGVEHQPYWITNMIWVRGDLSVVQRMAERTDVMHVYANPRVKLNEPTVEQTGQAQPEAIEWNILKVNADDVWGMGYTGQGAVIGGQDTGYDWDHPALVNQYRGWNGTTADHDYNWHDSIHENDPHTPAGNPCGFNSPEPCDDDAHGTHTMGTMVGDDGGANQIGMAPGARWIGCRNMEEGWGMPSTYAECYQFFVAPTRVDGSDPNPDMAPDVINNSWGCPASEGCTDPNVLLTAVQNLVAAGIVTAHSAGNSGSGCSTVDRPAAIYDESFTVGATNSSDVIASFSSRGPVTVDQSNRPKPDISAPGVSIRSSTPGGGYQGGWSGTSMAGPHVAGLVGLILSAQPALRGQVSEIENLIEQSAFHIAWEGCSSSGYPNNAYGWGRIDALAAVQMLPMLSLGKVASSATVLPGEVLTYTLTVDYLNALTPTTNVVLSDTLPAGTTFVSATEPYTLTGDTVQWGFAELMGTVEVDLAVRVDITATGSIINQNYSVMSDQVPLVTGEPVVTSVEKLAFLSLEKTASDDFVFPGEVMTYTLTVSNTHASLEATNVVLTDTLPVGTTFVWATHGFTRVGDVIEWEFASLGAMESVSVELVVSVDMLAGGVISNDEYAVRSDQAADVYGVPVNSLVGELLFLPLAMRLP